MTQDIREQRCAEIAEAVLGIVPLIFEGKSHPERLSGILPHLAQIRRIANAGPHGITDADYLAWLRVAPENLNDLEAAVHAGDADRAFAVFRDTETGVHLLTRGCAGCTGW